MSTLCQQIAAALRPLFRLLSRSGPMGQSSECCRLEPREAASWERLDTVVISSSPPIRQGSGVRPGSPEIAGYDCPPPSMHRSARSFPRACFLRRRAFARPQCADVPPGSVIQSVPTASFLHCQNTGLSALAAPKTAATIASQPARRFGRANSYTAQRFSRI